MNVYHIDATISDGIMKVSTNVFSVLEYKVGEYIKFGSPNCITTHRGPNLDKYLIGKVQDSSEPSISIWTCDSDKAEMYKNDILFKMKDLLKEKIKDIKKNIKIIDSFYKKGVLDL